MASYNETLIDDLRANGGHATSGNFVGRQVLILTTTGAKTGKRRESPLAYTRDGDRLVVVASKGGAPTNPNWYHNLKAHPEVTVEVGGEKFKVRAREADDADYERLYKNHAAKMPGFNEYRKKTTRHIPVMILERVN